MERTPRSSPPGESMARLFPPRPACFRKTKKSPSKTRTAPNYQNKQSIPPPAEIIRWPVAGDIAPPTGQNVTTHQIISRRECVRTMTNTSNALVASYKRMFNCSCVACKIPIVVVNFGKKKFFVPFFFTAPLPPSHRHQRETKCANSSSSQITAVPRRCVCFLNNV